MSGYQGPTGTASSISSKDQLDGFIICVIDFMSNGKRKLMEIKRLGILHDQSEKFEGKKTVLIIYSIPTHKLKRVFGRLGMELVSRSFTNQQITNRLASIKNKQTGNREVGVSEIKGFADFYVRIFKYTMVPFIHSW